MESIKAGDSSSFWDAFTCVWNYSFFETINWYHYLWPHWAFILVLLTALSGLPRKLLFPGLTPVNRPLSKSNLCLSRMSYLLTLFIRNRLSSKWMPLIFKWERSSFKQAACSLLVKETQLHPMQLHNAVQGMGGYCYGVAWIVLHASGCHHHHLWNCHL